MSVAHGTRFLLSVMSLGLDKHALYTYPGILINRHFPSVRFPKSVFTPSVNPCEHAVESCQCQGKEVSQSSMFISVYVQTQIQIQKPPFSKISTFAGHFRKIFFQKENICFLWIYVKGSNEGKSLRLQKKYPGMCKDVERYVCGLPFHVQLN